MNKVFQHILFYLDNLSQLLETKLCYDNMKNLNLSWFNNN